MKDFSFNPGDRVMYLDREYIVKSAVDLQKVLIFSPNKNTSIEVNVSDLEPINSKAVNSARELSLISERAWEIAKDREKVLKPLIKKPFCTLQMAKKASKKLGLKERQFYNLVKIYQESGCKLVSLVPRTTNGGEGKRRIKKELEDIINTVVRKFYLKDQRFKASKIIEEVRLICFNNKLAAPSESTVLRRLRNCCTEKEVTSKRFGTKAAQAKHSVVQGTFPQQEYPLQTYQIDHTVVDLIIVDELYRLPIGRPYITVAIDVYSRCIAGFCLTLEPPSAVSVGLCLVHAVLDKKYWLATRRIEAEWPIWGKPERIYVDNGADFHSAALKRGCEAHGIEINYRPIGKCHYGGIIERVIGTLMQLVHQLPGTTFSNIKERGEYRSEDKASLTLSELEKWLTIAIANYYHKKLHSGLKKPPLDQYTERILGTENSPGLGYPTKVNDKERFLIDFLPIEFRSLQRHGFMLDHIAYYNNSLSPFLVNRGRQGKFLIRRDPRDLSKIYVLEPKSQEYLEISCRTISRGSISLWEHRQALQYLREQGVKQLDEETIFRAIEAMREISKTAVVKSKAARRRTEIERQNKPATIVVDHDQQSKQNKVNKGVVKEEERVIYKGEWW